MEPQNNFEVQKRSTWERETHGVTITEMEIYKENVCIND